MKNVKELAEHFAGRAVLAGATRLPPSLPEIREPLDVHAHLTEKERMCRAFLNQKLGMDGDMDCSPWESWFLSQRWALAADWFCRLDEALQETPLKDGPSLETLLPSFVSVARLRPAYRFALIRLWEQWSDWWLLHVAFSICNHGEIRIAFC